MNASAQKTTSLNQGGTSNQQAKGPFVMGKVFNYTALSRLLRFVGAGTLIAAIYLFLFQGWQTGNDIDRYRIMLTQTLGLSIAGFACSYWLNENKSARLLLGLSLLSVPVNFAILGGLLYSQIQWDTGLSHYPEFARWSGDSLISTLLTAVVGVLVLIPVIIIGFMILARQSAARLSLLFILGSAAILLPVRNIEIIGGFLLILTIIMLQQSHALQRHDTSLHTLEGRFARYLLFLPAGIILARATYLYEADALMFTVIAGFLYGIFRQLAVERAFSVKFRIMMEYLGSLAAVGVGIGLITWLDSFHSLPDEITFLLFVICLTGLLLEISVRACKGGAGYRRAAAMVLTMGILTNLLMFPGVMTASISLFIGIILVTYAYSIQQRIAFTFGLFAVLAGLGYHIHFVMHVFNLISWMSLSLLGITTILFASVLDRYGHIIRSQLWRWQKRFKSWEY